MALFSALRRAVTSVAPATNIGRFGSTRLHPLRLRRTDTGPLHGRISIARTAFCSVTESPKSDGDLLLVLDSEIKVAGQPERAQVPFEIKDEPGTRSVTLRRNYGKETVEAQIFFEEVEDLGGDDDADQVVEYPLRVVISKGDGPRLEFNCLASVDELIIENVLYKKDDRGEEASNAFGGPLFEDLDEDLQQALYKYLERRGISDDIIKFLRRYMANKYEREYLRWLGNVKHFIEK